MKKLRAAIILLGLVLLFSLPGFSQSNNATLGGTVSDPSGALVPGVNVKATNQATGIVTSVISNDAGVYNLAGLLPGVYKVTAELPGFRTQTYSDVQLGNAAQARLNISLSLASVANTVDVTVNAQNLIMTSSSSVGEVLPQKQIQDLPLVSNNILDLIGVMAGVSMTNSPVFGAEGTNFAGVSARDVNVQRDGISINNGRWPNGLDSPTRMNPDLVGEIKMILAPVDAEMGRGNGQVQIQTRSGTNKYSGALVWNVQNSALDANTWVNNRNQTPNNLGVVRATQPAYRNFHEYNLAFGGPIKRNKTFFYALWDQQFILTRNVTNPTVLTDCARLGIFRYYDGINNGNSRQLTITGASPQQATVNTDGSPKAPLDGSGNPLPLRFLSVFGPLAANPTKNDCSDAQISTSTLVPTGATSSWDANRKQLDKAGFMTKMLGLMPHANGFDNPGNLTAIPNVTFVPDGLNTATHQWLRRAKGADNLFGVGQDNNRRQFNIKLDHNFSSSHKLNGSYSYEKDVSDDAALPAWPTGYPGQDIRKPQVLSVGFTSTLSTTLLNEARFGLSRTGANTGGAVNRADVGEEVLKLFPQVGGQTVLANLGFQSMVLGSGIQGLPYDSHEVSPRWTYADTLSWTRGAHAFKFGGEYRIASTKSTLGGSVQGGANRPTVSIGNTTTAPVTGIGRPLLAGTALSGNQQTAENLLTWLSGSLSGLAQARFINDLSGTWNDYAKDPVKIRDIHQNEIGTFVKDDWKVTRDLTLNLGVRWDYYGVPWEASGLTTGLKGGGNSLFGISGNSFKDWMKPGVRADLMEIIYVGPNSPNPSQSIYDRDMNNFGPAVGFAWQVPGIGKGTTVRGGYQIQFLGGGRGFVLDTAIGNPPGSSNTANYIVPAGDPYFSVEKLVANPSLIPVQPTFLPKAAGTVIPVTDRTGLLNAFDPSFIAPSVQNFTLSVTRNITRKVTLDMRYIGTLSRKLWANLDLNAPNFMYNGLKEAFDAARSGGESQLLNDLFAGLNIAGTGCSTPTTGPTPCGPVGTTPTGGVLQTGAMHLRAAAASGIRTNLANGNYVGLATTLNTLTINCLNSGNSTATACTNGTASLAGSVLRNNPGKFPENFIKANPQFSTAVLETNPGHSNYHSVQAQVSLRPTAGVSLQGTYTFSRNIGQAPGEGANGTGSIYTDPADRMADYALLASHRKHGFVTYGTFELPLGPNKMLFKNASGIWGRLAEGWQASWVANLVSGSPANVSAQSMLYGLGVPDIVGPFDIKALNYFWKEGSVSGNIFADANGVSTYSRVKDPQCLNASYVQQANPSVPSFVPLATSCTLNAVANSSSQVLLQTPLPGKRGNFGQNRFENVGSWTADMAIQKRVKVSESKSMTIRLDATNVFNHPTPGVAGLFAPAVGASDLSLQGANPFGAVTSKAGSRRFQLKARLDF